MAYTLRELHAAEHHVAQAQQNIRTQWDIIQQLDSRGLPSEDAYRTLEQLLSTLHDLQRRCDCMRAMLDTEAA